MPRILIAVAVLVLAAPVLSEDEPTRWKISPDQLEFPQDEWFGLYINGNKAGFVHIRFEEVGEGETRKYVQHVEFEIKLVGLGAKSHMQQRERAEYEVQPPYRMRVAISERTDNERVQVVRVANTAGELRALITEAQGKRQLTREPADITLSDDLTTAFWIRSKPSVGDSVTVRSFDISDLKDSLMTYTLTAIRETVISGVKTEYYEGRIRSSVDGEMGVGRFDPKGSILSWQMGVMELRREPEELARRFDYGADLFKLTMAKIDEPLGPATGVASMTVEVTGKAARTIEAGPRQEVLSSDDGTVLLRLGDGAKFEATVSEEETQKNLAATVEYPVDDPRVIALAKKAVGDAAGPRAKVRRLVSFVSDYVEDSISDNSSSALDVIRAKAGDCTEHALLFTCLARAAGIPARTVSGLMYMGDKFQAFGGHAWNEVVLDGEWVPVDPSWGEMPTDGTHIRFGAEGRGAAAQAGAMGNIGFKLREIVRK